MAGKNFTTGITLDKRKLEEIEREFPGRAGQVVGKLANMCASYAKSHMSSESPSAEGQPPGIDTSTLVNSIGAEPDPTTDLVWYVIVGAHYGVDLEYGTVNMGARPFMLPAVGWTAANVPRGLLAEVVE